MRSITLASADAVQIFTSFCCTNVLFSFVSYATAWARACANCCFTIPWTSDLIRAASVGEMVVPLYSSVMDRWVSSSIISYTRAALSSSINSAFFTHFW